MHAILFALRKYFALAVLIFIQQVTTNLRADDGPYIQLRGKVILPAGVDRDKLICELVEGNPNRRLRYQVTPIKLNDDLTFETRTMGLSYHRTVLLVSNLDKTFEAAWYSDEYELLSNSAKQLELKLALAERRAVQVTYEAKPQAGAKVLVFDEFNLEPLTTDKNGIVWIRPSGDGHGVFLAATAQDRLVAQPQVVKLPVDGSPLQLALQKCELAPVQVVGTDDKPVADVTISSFGLGDERRSKEPAFATFLARSDQNGVTTPLFFSIDGEFEILSPNMRFISFDRSSKPHRVVVAPVQPKVEVRGKIDLPSESEGGLLLRGSSRDDSNRFSIFVCRVTSDGSFVAQVHPEFTYKVLAWDATWVSNTWSGIMASSKPDSATPVSLDIVEGEPVEVQITRGEEFAPAKGVWIAFLEMGGQRRWSARTDDEGVVVTRASQGELKLYAYQDEWGQELKATVRPGEANVLTIHRNEFEPVDFTGQVTIADTDTSKVALSEIGLSMHIEDNLTAVPISVGDEGRFQATAAKPHIALSAKTKDRKHCGTQSFDLDANNGDALTLELHPSISIFGRILDPDGLPLPETRIELMSYTDETANTDTLGRYSFAGVCSRVPYGMNASYRNRQGYATNIFYNHIMGERDVLLPTVIMPESDMNSRSLQTRLKNRISSSRLLNTNVVFIHYGSGKSAIDMAEGLFANDESKVSSNLSPLLFSSADLQGYPANATWITEHGLELSTDQELMVALFDQKGNPIFRKRILEAEFVNSISEIIGLEQLQLVEQNWDAKSRFEKALELARRTDRDIWASFVSARNLTAIALHRWQDENREELEKHFVLLQIDRLRDENADAMADRFGFVMNSENRLDCVLINKAGRQLHEISSQFIDREQIEVMMKATSKPIDPAKTKAWLDSL